MTAVRVELLGPLRLVVDGRSVEVPGHRRRAVLAMLAKAAGHPVGVDSLIDAIWPEDPPETGHQAVHSHISRLRRHLGPAAGLLRRVGAGYCLDQGEDGTDVAQARRLGRELAALLRTDPPEAARTATAALSLWRGTALEEFADIAPLAAEAAGLAELFVRLRGDALEARLASGEGSVAADAASAAREQPLRERTATLLVRSLATEGRTAEAMAAASVYRRWPRRRSTGDGWRTRPASTPDRPSARSSARWLPGALRGTVSRALRRWHRRRGCRVRPAPWSRFETVLGADSLGEVRRGAAGVGRPRIVEVARQALVVLN